MSMGNAMADSFQARLKCEEASAASSFVEGLQHNFGSKSIGMFAGVALLINNITGPGIPSLPNQFVESGWVWPTVCIFVVWVMTTLSAAMYTEAMRHVPGNEHFRDRVEYTTIVRYFFGRKWYLLSQIGLNGALQALNIISVVQSAQVMDSAISAMFGKTCGINLTPFQNVWTDAGGVPHNVHGSNQFLSCIDTSNLDVGNGWGCHVVLSLGFLMVAAFAIPCGRWNLDDNMIIQVVAFVLTIVCWIGWFVASAVALNGDSGIGSRTKLQSVNNDPDVGSLAGVLGTVLFNFGFVTTVPSWVNEKRPGVSVNKSLWVSTTLTIIVFFFVGIVPAIAFADVLQGPVTNTCARNARDSSFNCPNDLMQALSSNAISHPWNNGAISFLVKLSVYLFPIVAVVSSIPVFSIVIKYNMMENGFSKSTGFWWGVVFPWLVGLPLAYMPGLLQSFVNFTSIVFVTFTDFIVPCALFLVLLWKRRDAAPEQAMEGVKIHRAFSLILSPIQQGFIAVLIAIALTILSVCAFILAVQQGSYSFDEQACALVGS